MPWAGYENHCRAEKPPAADGADSGYSLGLYAAGCYADTGFNAVRPDVGHADRAAALFNAAARFIPNPDAGSGNTNAKGNAGGNQQRGRSYGPLYPAD